MKIISDSWRLILVLLVFVGVTCNPAVYEDIIWGHRGLEFDSIDEALNFHSK